MKNVSLPVRTLRLAPLAGALALGLSTGATAAPTDAYALQLAQRQQRHSGTLPAAAVTAPVGPNATLPVTSCADDTDPGTLRNVMMSAGEGDVIDLSALTCSTITLTEGRIDVSMFGHQVLDLTLLGPGENALVIDANGAEGITHGDFLVGAGTLTIKDLTIRNGNGIGGLASCLRSNGNVVLERVTVTDCHASNGGPITFGGAMSVSGKLTMISSTISASSVAAAGDNVAMGGGVYVDSLEMTDSTISGNSARADVGSADDGYYITVGGGAYVRGNLTLHDSTISGNTIETTSPDLKADGGGLFVRGEAQIVGSTIADNSADGDGGGLFKMVYSMFGDINATKLVISNSTVSGNSARSGGGIASSRGVILANSTVAFNTGSEGAGGVMFRLDGVEHSLGDLSVQSSIVAHNDAGDGAPLATDLDADAALTVTGANSLVQQAGATITLPADTLDTDPLLLPLAWNGGPTRTHALGAGSPAIDTGNNAANLSFDQRGEGFARVSGAAADIGAFEMQQPPPDADLIFRDGFDGAAEPTTVEYSYDDGDGDTNQGPPSSFDPDMLWGNYYLAQPGGEVITKISIAFGPTFPSLANGPVAFWLLQDDDADLDPRNAHVVASIEATPDVINDEFFTVQISPTWVHGGFFVGASAKLEGGADKPARVDRDASGDKSWFFYAPDIAATIDDLAAAPFGTRNDNTQYVPLPGAFMVRATGTSTP